MTVETALVMQSIFIRCNDAIPFLSRCCEIVADPVLVCSARVGSARQLPFVYGVALEQYRILRVHMFFRFTKTHTRRELLHDILLYYHGVLNLGKIFIQLTLKKVHLRCLATTTLLAIQFNCWRIL